MDFDQQYPEPDLQKRAATFRAKTLHEQLKEVEALKLLVRTMTMPLTGGVRRVIGMYERILRENPVFARFDDLDSPEKPN